MVYNGKSKNKMDDLGGPPWLRKPPPYLALNFGLLLRLHLPHAGLQGSLRCHQAGGHLSSLVAEGKLGQVPRWLPTSHPEEVNKKQIGSAKNDFSKTNFIDFIDPKIKWSLDPCAPWLFPLGIISSFHVQGTHVPSEPVDASNGILLGGPGLSQYVHFLWKITIF